VGRLIDNMATYKSVVIGNQEWMQYNLNVRKFRNGDPIPVIRTTEEWADAFERQMPACCFFENMKWIGWNYGKLYNWYAVNDPRRLAPEGWHIPSDDEWEKLVTYLGGRDSAGAKLKSRSEWEDPLGTNESRFSALPGCSRSADGEFHGIEDDNNWWKCYGYWWSSTEKEDKTAWCRNLYYANSLVYRESFYKGYGFSVRCLKD
jgi:uncharacterized protein (TIGR02145 family)